MPQAKRCANTFLVVMIVGIFILSAVFILLTTRPAWPATPADSQPYTCEDVRRLIAEKGKVAAIAFAVERGLSIRQIWQIRRTCRV
ncbi:hypothetical protein ABIF68_007845 [Bradyrhizobium japonicum]|jgi:hypothetical protein|uniref:hypothetical protein n=1 Tax=Bradyrhizobium TaxID=374 RepID=UPI0004AFF299|nr:MULTISPECIES: hypothetical protein [Bradyrhizobium]MDI2071531.1 hypothetical protein [Bradyrhizobium sp. Mp27]